MNKIDLSGVGVALVTPFQRDDSQSVDYAALERLLEHCISNGVNYFIVNGTTAENPVLTTEEKQQILQFVLKITAGRIPVVFGIGGNNTNALVEELNTFNTEGVSAVLSASPYYNKPSQEGIYQHYAALSAASPLPLIVYNVPGRTSSNISAQTTIRLAKDFGNVVAIKEASGNLDQITEILLERPEGFQVLSGDDNLTFAMMALGAEGVISVSGQGIPEVFCAMVEHMSEGRWIQARAAHLSIYDLTNQLFEEGNPVGIKALLETRGITQASVRLPLVEATDNLKNALAASLEILNLT
jgi:4-hydroxy-tetrahydrodipicolinate synthase